MRKIILNSQLIDENKAFIHVTDLSLLRGYGIFDFFRLDGAKPVFCNDHLDRFFNSARIMRLQIPDQKPELKSLISQMLKENKIASSGVRLVLTGGESPNGYSIGRPTFFAINEPINALPPKHFTEGIKLITHEYLRDLPEVKTTNYLQGIHLKPEVEASHAVDVLYTWQGNVLEVTRSNLFIVTQEGIIKTAKDNILNGINRQHVIKMIGTDYQIDEEAISITDLKEASEVFMTGTTKKITPVVQIDDHVFGDGNPGRLTKILMSEYDNYLSEYLKSIDPLF